MQESSLNGIAERGCIPADAVVPREDRHQRRWLAQQFRCRQVYGIERANGFNRKRPPDACEHGVRHGDDVAATFESPQCPYRRPLLLGRQSARSTGTKDGPGSFRKRQC